MNEIVVIFLILAAAGIGAVVAWLAMRGRAAALAQRKAELEVEIATSGTQLTQAQQEVSELKVAKAVAEQALDDERRNSERTMKALVTAGEEMKAQFAALASDALQRNNSSFLELAKSKLETQQEQAKGELAQKEQAVKNLVDPIAQSLQELQQQIQLLEQARSQAYGSLSTQVVSLTATQKALQVETGNLVRALRDPQTRGRWGELQLRKVLELAGMLEYCDFEEQVSVSLDDHRLRPDVIVRLPGAKNVVIDAKAPLSGYLNALEAQDEAAQKACLADHVRQIRKHMDDLATKAYWQQFQPTPEFVLLFLPGEVFFRAAVMADPELLEHGEGKVILTSPMTLIAVLKSVAYGWNQKNLAENALKIIEAGKLLYQRLAVMAGHFEEVGKKLGGAVEAYNKSVGSMERSVFPVARKLPELDRSLSAEEVPDLKQVDKSPRQLEAPDWELTADAAPLRVIGDDADRPAKQ